MKRNSWVVDFLAWFFLFLGILWLVTIYSRCRVVALRSPCRVSGAYRLSEYNFIRTAKTVAAKSPGIQSSDLLAFWMLAAMEMMCSFLYIISGFALLRRYKFGFRMSRSALWADLAFKILTAAYMFGIAVPLEGALKNNQNLLLNYFTPARSALSDCSAFFSGLRFYYPAVNFSVVVYFMYFLCVYIFVKQRIEGAEAAAR